MPAQVTVLGMRQRLPRGVEGRIINTCSNSDDSWQRDLSPFIIGPCNLYSPYISQTVENAWQYSKLYEEHASYSSILDDFCPTKAYWDWAGDGWSNPRAVRFPMGRGVKPLYSYWDGEHLGYIDARKQIYVPLYARAVLARDGWRQLKEIYEQEEHIVLRDFDGYNHNSTTINLTLTEVLNNPRRKMGHAFVLKMMLTRDKALEETAFDESCLVSD